MCEKLPAYWRKLLFTERPRKGCSRNRDFPNVRSQEIPIMVAVLPLFIDSVIIRDSLPNSSIGS
jgi:hypothetical protein